MALQKVYQWDPSTMNVLGAPLKAMDTGDVDKVVKHAKVASDAWKKSSFEG